jgi:hypothetical protein
VVAAKQSQDEGEIPEGGRPFETVPIDLSRPQAAMLHRKTVVLERRVGNSRHPPSGKEEFLIP